MVQCYFSVVLFAYIFILSLQLLIRLFVIRFCFWLKNNICISFISPEPLMCWMVYSLQFFIFIIHEPLNDYQNLDNWAIAFVTISKFNLTWISWNNQQLFTRNCCSILFSFSISFHYHFAGGKQNLKKKKTTKNETWEKNEANNRWLWSYFLFLFYHRVLALMVVDLNWCLVSSTWLNFCALPVSTFDDIYNFITFRLFTSDDVCVCVSTLYRA